MKNRRQYYSSRAGKNSLDRLDLATLKKLFRAFYWDICRAQYLDELLGKDCVDDATITGTAGPNVHAFVLRKVRKDNLWPVPDKLDQYAEDDLFDMIEFLYDHVSAGVSGEMHEQNGCGMHFTKFDRTAAQQRFRIEINELLEDYSDGYSLSETGEIERLPESGFAKLIASSLPSADPKNIDARVKSAVTKYLRRSSTTEDRRSAVRDLVDVLEFLRPDIKRVLTKKDESDLFNIANNFGIRHHSADQSTNYDEQIWISWMFYFYLATIHAAQRLIARGSNGA